MAVITFENKVALREVLIPRKNAITAEDINEIKESVNELYDNPVTGATFWTVDLMDTTTGTVYAPFNMKIDSIDNVFGDPTLTITVNGFAYTLGDNISLGAQITFTIATQGVNNVNFTVL